MSGRGHSYSRGRGRGSGRGSGSSRRNQSKGSDKDKKSGNADKKKVFEPYYAGKHQSDTYDSVKEQIVLHIQNNYTDSHRVVAILCHEDDSKDRPTKPTMKKVSYTNNN